MINPVERKYSLRLSLPLRRSACFRYHGEKDPGFTTHHYFQFSGVNSGKFYFDFPDNDTCVLNKGDAILIAPDTPHIWRSPQNEASEIIVLLCDVCEKEKFGEISEILTPWINNKYWTFECGKGMLKDFVHDVTGLLKGKSMMKESILFARHLLFMAEACELLLEKYGLPERNIKITESIIRVLYHIEELYMRPVFLKDLAKMAGLSPSRFSEMFTKCMKKSPIQYLNDFRIKKAEYLLSNSNLSMEEIASKTGFSSMHYFCRMFKIKNGSPPALFRKKTAMDFK